MPTWPRAAFACLLAATCGGLIDAVCTDEQTNCNELLGSGLYTCDTNLHELSQSFPSGVTLNALCCHSCETMAPTPPPTPISTPPPPLASRCINDAVCGTPVGDTYGCDADMSIFMHHLEPGTTLSALCPQKCDASCRGEASGDELGDPCSDTIDDCPSLVVSFSCAWNFGIVGHASLQTLCPSICDDSCSAGVAKPAGQLNAADAPIMPPQDAGPTACLDDRHWGSEHGDCSSYAPGQPNFGYCQRDGADQHCLISCGICTGGNPTCWQGDFSFQRCCGGTGGDPACFDTTFTFETCCATETVSISQTPPEHIVSVVASGAGSRRLCSDCQDCADCRIDPADGNAYTRAQFIAQYGGTAEWEAADPTVDSDGGANGSDAEIPRTTTVSDDDDDTSTLVESPSEGEDETLEQEETVIGDTTDDEEESDTIATDAVRVDTAAEVCEKVYLGPDMGYVNLMEYHNTDGLCHINIYELRTICSGDMLQTCLDFIDSAASQQQQQQQQQQAAHALSGSSTEARAAVCSELQQAVLSRCLDNCAECDRPATKIVLGNCMTGMTAVAMRIQGEQRATEQVAQVCQAEALDPPASGSDVVISGTAGSGTISPSSAIDLHHENDDDDVRASTLLADAWKVVAGVVTSVVTLSVLLFVVIRCCKHRPAAAAIREKNSIYTGPEGLYKEADSSSDSSYTDELHMDVDIEIVNPSRKSRLPSEIETV